MTVVTSTPSIPRLRSIRRRPPKQPGQHFRAGPALSSGCVGRVEPFMTFYWKPFSHNGVAVPDPYLPEGLNDRVRGREGRLPALAEGMADLLGKKEDSHECED